MKIQSKFMTGLVSRIVKKVLRTKLGCEVDIQLNEFRTTVIDDKTHVHLDLDADLTKEELNLTYFADGVLADECGEIVDDVEEIIGDGLDHFGEYEDDSVFVRSDAKRCDYEILKDLRDFSDFKKKNFPPNNDEEV